MGFIWPVVLIPLFLGAAEETFFLRQASQGKVNASEDEAGNGNPYKFDLNLRAGDGVKITGDAFKGGDDSIYGCGLGDRKCKCLYPADGFQMQGFGTDGTWTGLEFWCRNIKFSMPGHDPKECTCNFKAMINFWDRGREFVPECSPKQCFRFVDYAGQGQGTVNDLEDRFQNPDGGGDISLTSWDFHIQADALGEPKKPQPDTVLGGWQPISAGASISIKQSTTWSSTSTRAELNEVAKSFTQVMKYSYKLSGGVSVPVMADAKSEHSIEVSFSATQSWKTAVTDTYSKTEGGAKEFTCTPQACQGGTSYQWQTAVTNHQDDWGALFDSCIFVCMPDQGVWPKCPYGACCSKDVTDQCSKCSVEWCDKSDPTCPFHDPSFKPGCDEVQPETVVSWLA